MSDDPVEYKVRSPEPLAQVEPEVDYYRRKLRQLRAWLEELDQAGPEDLGRALMSSHSKIRQGVIDLLDRPRSNGPAIDRLERELGELRGKLIDFDIMRKELAAAKEAAQLWQRRAEGGPVKTAVVSAAGRLDRWLGRK